MNNIKLLKKLVSTNSYSFNKNGVDEVGDIIARELSFMKITKVKGKDNGDLLMFESVKSDASKPKIVLVGHSDTVHHPDRIIPISTGAKKLFGPGTQDMKGGLVSIIEVIKHLHQYNQLTNVSFSLVPNEEIQWPEHKEVMSEFYKKHDVGLVYEPTLQFQDWDLSKYYPNTMSFVTTRKGALRGEFIITGPGGHSGVIDRKQDRISAINEAAKTILALEELSNYQKGTTINVGLINGGSFHNVLADYCKFEIDTRLKQNSEIVRILKAYNQLADKPFYKQIKKQYNNKTSASPMVKVQGIKDLIDSLSISSEKLGINIKEEARGGGSDAALISAVGVPVLDGLGAQGFGEHTSKEFVYIDSIERSSKLTIGLIKELLTK